ncbi:hypothetical protein GYMLUDRAFT_65306 [Collybiopsis luxurians FD-317 M1]|uniref:Uncharacterized protein n=1 Tax=Collybiopsis luxurians FD-317 M1 TaxID=944289 RepID=A0A0D0B897_9AGAR|nr:hypothetical protein GYMLUDRAFT_65306 [Collybiopsis luxurians FD-317 M1]
MEDHTPLSLDEQCRSIHDQFTQLLTQQLFSTAADEENALQSFGLDKDEREDDTASASNCNSEYFPYPDRLMLMLDVLSNLPWLRLSEAHFKLILFLLNDSGVPNVPSFNGFRKMQEELQRACANAVKWVVKHMNFYPEETKGPISEVWQAERWHKFDPSHHTPTCYIGGKQFWINKLAKLSDNCLVIPKTWVKCEGVVCADAEEVTIDNNGKWEKSMELINIPSDLFQYTYQDIEASLNGQPIPWKGQTS